MDTQEQEQIQQQERPTVESTRKQLEAMKVPELLTIITEHNEEYPDSPIPVVAGAPKIVLIGEILKAFEAQLANLEKSKVKPAVPTPPMPPVTAAAAAPEQPVRKFYETTQGQTHTRAGKFVIRMTPYESAGGNVMAVYETDKPEEIAELDKLVEAKRIAVITEKQFNECMKKKSQGSNPFGHTLFDKPLPAKAAPVAAINPEPPAQPKPGDPLATASDAVDVGKV